MSMTGNSWRFPENRVLVGKAPPKARTIGALIEEMAARAPDNEAVVLDEQRWSYGELDRRASKLALGLLANDIGKRDHIAIFMGNRPEWMAVWMAANRIGAVVVGVSTWSSPSELEYILRHSDARMLVYADRIGPRNLQKVVKDCFAAAGWSESTPYSPRLPCLRKVVPVRTGGGASSALEEIARSGAAVPEEILAALSNEVRPSDVALLLYTSGSTSTPKGVQLIHRALVEHAYDIGEAEDLHPKDRYWLSLPLFWSAGSANTAMAVLTHGATIVLQEHFEAKLAAKVLRDERCTHYFAFPNVTRAIHQELGKNKRLPATRVAVSTGQPETLRMLQEMGFSLLLHPYGTTEDYGFATINRPDDPIETLTWSQGRALPGIDLAIADTATGKAVAHGTVGEVLLRGNVTVGYYKDEDKNRAVFDSDGYFHTGDTGMLHEGGRLQFLGRNNEMIKSSGFNVSPAEVENALLTHPSVAEVHVVGAPDPERGQTVVACVKLSKAGVDTEALRAHCGTLLSSYKVPRKIVVFDKFPLTSTGKVSKLMLRDLVSNDEKAKAKTA